MILDTVKYWFEQHQFAGQVLVAVGILLLSLASYLVTRHYLFEVLKKIVKNTRTEIDDIFFEKVILRRVSYIAPIVVVYFFAHLFPLPDEIIRKVSIALIWWLILLTAGASLTVLSDIFPSLKISRGRPIKGYIQVIKLIIYVIGGIIIMSSLFGKSPFIVLSGFGAMTAVMLLIFRDTILSFVASLQINSNDLVRIGDWIEVPKFDADGDVIDIALHTVKIQNWDKTITVIPTHKLIEETFKNWRGMQLSGGRRIKRSVLIDLESVKFCDDQMIERFGRYQLISDYVQGKKKELALYNREQNIDTEVLVNGRRMTNIGTFRAYIEAYLKNHQKIHQDMTFLVRHLPPGPKGLPIEIYVFTNDTDWGHYEGIQADIFDHILAVVPEFGLRIFQNPTGGDFAKLGIRSNVENKNC